jgi:hypothetical protein
MSAEVRMVVGSVKEITNAIVFGNNTTKAAHIRLLDEKDFSSEKIEILSHMQRHQRKKNISVSNFSVTLEGRSPDRVHHFSRNKNVNYRRPFLGPYSIVPS